MATEVNSNPAAAMPQLQSLQKAMALPTIGAAVDQFGVLYTKVKGAHSLLDWALSTAEASMTLAATRAAPLLATPIAFGDAKIAYAIDELERRVPLVTEEPKVIVETTKQAVLSRISPHVTKVCGARNAAEQRVKSLKELSWTKANALLSTAYGQKALHSVDTGAMYVMQLLDHYLPPVGPQPEPTNEIVLASNDPALHTVQTVGRLSAVAARRVWANLAYKINELRNSGIEFDVRRYIAALLAALHLANVTNQQHEKEKEQEEKETQNIAEPTPVTTSPPASQPTAPPTATVLKTTPEGKSGISEKANKQ
ncbi:lipid storage droplets surface-binding protein 2 [Achroia grisella]|uniref:lipid storage droplets surface-binding protein 2 n=1 Tax=Achroia grisella TaxID=688607 RepID=UPI0027D2D670|nr:lipid storage droplets surface-binding protein 2 [Achroia grisella]XP_059054522.1 lipid storage droplets surface-binding protein 2 [Achroia grisella]